MNFYSNNTNKGDLLEIQVLTRTVLGKYNVEYIEYSTFKLQ